MKNKKFIYLITTMLAVTLATTNANAVSVTNLDSEPQTIQITQDGNRKEVTIQAGETANICQDSLCFVLFPSETMLLLSNQKSVNIKNGEVEIKD